MEEIEGATSDLYKLRVEDVGCTVACRVTPARGDGVVGEPVVQPLPVGEVSERMWVDEESGGRIEGETAGESGRAAEQMHHCACEQGWDGLQPDLQMLGGGHCRCGPTISP